MKGKIIIEAIPEERVEAECAANGWTEENAYRAGLTINIGMTATRRDVVEICAGLCEAFKMDAEEKAMLFLRLIGGERGYRSKSFRVSGPRDGQRAEAGDAPPAALMILRKEAFDHV